MTKNNYYCVELRIFS